MIVVSLPPGLALVRQRDHAELSARLAEAWTRPQVLAPPVWERFVEAVRHHDDGWRLAEEEPRLDSSGRPHDFKNLPTELHATIWRDSVKQGCERDPYVGLLVAQHCRWLYSLLPRGSMADRSVALALVKDMQEVHDECVAQLDKASPEEELAVRKENLQLARRLLSFFDAISLMLLGGIPQAGRSEELTYGEQTGVLSLTWKDDALGVAPWPFQPASCEEKVPVSCVPRATFESPADLTRTMKEAPAVTYRRVLRPKI